MNLIKDEVRVLIIGANGQDGRIISTRFQEFGIETLGITSQSSQINLSGKLIAADFSNLASALSILDTFQPTHIFHLGAVHGSSAKMQGVVDKSAQLMRDCHVGIVQNLIAWAINHINVRIFVALTSQMYSPRSFIDKISESTPFSPQNFYGQTKLEGFELLKQARKEYGIKISSGILFNHSSIYSKSEFLFPQIAQQLEGFIKGYSKLIKVRNANSLVAVGAATEFCDAMIRICFSDEPCDYVIAHPKLSTIHDLIIDASILLESTFIPEIVSEFTDNPNSIVVGDISKARTKLGWSPEISPAQLLASMTKMGIFHD